MRINTSTINTARCGLILALIAGISVGSTQLPAPNILYAAPNGTGPGTAEAPLALEAVPARIREANHKAGADVIVYLRGGEYQLREPLRFGAFHSGYSGYSVVLAAHQDEVPVITGAWRVRGWSDAGEGIAQAQVGVATFRNLFVNDQRAVRARTPNVGTFARVKSWDEADVRSGGRINIDKTFVAEPSALLGSTIVVHRNWAGTHLEIERALVNGDLLQLETRDPWRTVLFSRPVPFRRREQTFFVENHRLCLDAEGEWYHDRKTGVIYYKLRAGETAATLRAEIPVVETLLEVVGEPHLPVHDIEFRGIHFRRAAWNFVNREHGLLEGQNGWHYGKETSGPRYYWEKQGSAVIVRAAERIRFKQCIFSGSDGAGLAIENWTRAIVVEESIFRDLGGCGLLIGIPSNWQTRNWFPEHPAEIPASHIIRRNIVTRTGIDYFSSSSISAAYVKDLVIEENDISFNPYHGISVGCGWTSGLNATTNNLVRANVIHDVMQIVDDGAGIYTLSAGYGNRIENNHIYGVKKSEWAQAHPIAGIYLDEGGEGMVVQKNVIEIEPDSGAKVLNLNRTGVNTFVDNGPNFDGAAEVRKRAGLGESATLLLRRMQQLESSQP